MTRGARWEKNSFSLVDMESVLTIVLALGVAGTAIRLLPVQENYRFETATRPVQGKPLDEIDGVIKAKIATGLVEDTRVKTARPKPAAPRAEREIVQDTRILTATPTPDPSWADEPTARASRAPHRSTRSVLSVVLAVPSVPPIVVDTNNNLTPQRKLPRTNDSRH